MEHPLRIAVFGPESTGKTQLAEKLAAHFGAPCVPEYARQFWDEHGAIGLEDIPTIARRQWALEDAAVRAAAIGQCHLIDDTDTDRAAGSRETCNPLDYKPPGATRLIICDTEALTTVLWSDLLYGTCPDDIRRGAEKRARHYALYLLLDIDLPFGPDPQRCFPDPADREKCMRIWRGALERRHLPFQLIAGDWAARGRAAVAAVEKLLASEADASS